MDLTQQLSRPVVGVIIILSILTAASSATAGVKCTKSDPRNGTFPECMQAQDLVLWCNFSNHTKVPDPDKIKADCSFRNSVALYLNDSCIRTLTKAEMEKYPNIEDFRCGENLITSISPGVFSGNGYLTSLSLDSNAISQIVPGAFQGLHKLEILNLTSNKIQKLSRKMFYGLGSLKELFIGSNQLQTILRGQFRGMKALETLVLTGNLISHIDENGFDGLQNLRRLHLDGNDLQVLQRNTFIRLPSLRVLTLSYNRISKLPEFAMNSFPNLHTLNLAHNILGSFEASNFANLSKLQNLSLQNNSLDKISEDLFFDMPSLRYVNLSSNAIMEISRCAFSKSCHLEVLSLSKNRLQMPYAEWFTSVMRNDIIEGTDISGNDWYCKEKMLPYQDFLSSVSRKWRKILDITCNYPKQHKGEQLSELVFERSMGLGNNVSSLKGGNSSCSTGNEETFVRQTEVYTYQPKTTYKETKSQGLDLTTLIFYGEPEHMEVLSTQQHESNMSVPMIVMGVIIASLLLAIIAMACKKRTTKKTRESCSSGKGLIDTNHSRLDSIERERPYSRTDSEEVFQKISKSIVDPDIPDKGSNTDTLKITTECPARERNYRTSSSADSGIASNRSSSVNSEFMNVTRQKEPSLLKVDEVEVSIPSHYEEVCTEYCQTVPKMPTDKSSHQLCGIVSESATTDTLIKHPMPVRLNPIGGNPDDIAV